MPEKRWLVTRVRQRDRALNLDASVGKDVAQLGSAITQHLADQEPAMALSRSPTAAEQCKALIPTALQQALDGLLECRLRRHLAIQRMPSGIVLLVPLGTAPQRQSKKRVADPSLFYRRVKALSVEVGCKSRIGIRANVDEELDVLALNELDEPIEVMIRMPDGPNDGESRWH